MPFLVIANWKSHKNQTQAQAWIKDVAAQHLNLNPATVEVVIAPPVSLLGVVANELGVAGLDMIELGVQDLSSFPPGAYTGATAAENLEGWPVKYALVGHSERRRYFHETHVEVAQKVSQALEHGITPIVCLDDEYLQLQAAAINPDELSRCVVAYEPLEAIGSGTPQSADEVAVIIKRIHQVFGTSRVIYGGSVDAENVSDYQAICQGVLVGTDSLKAADFSAILKAV